jgi:hypothetical protein
MADDQSTSGQRQPSERLQELANQHGGMSPGMTSPDSTQAPLRASDGEPDEQAMGGASGGRGGRGDEPVEDEDGR